MIKLVIFDLDGTLVDAYEAIIRSVNFTLQKTGYPKASAMRIRKAVGWGDKRLLAAFIKEGQIVQALAIYRKHHRKSLKQYSKLLPYSKNALEYLSGKKIKIAIASNRPTEFTHIILKYLKLKKYFDYVLCADKLPKGKPHPEILIRILKKLKVKPGEAIFVGDMAVDVETAHNARLKAIAVTTGSSSRLEIKKARPWGMLKSLASLKKYL